ncbi:uncharacterized protein MELLADRAFT_33552 [Melampsora larici-populina 98AG31]|uniref:DUF1688-domain-containing protein n=1 Tax=Melampsora larici-populina (strain 98AG31 / pathotype 3-4-7) TaxID=747676 RepID=F4R9N1_MELLP|nr:uncharacterized protein MELLADRAFT_33552 [Melampsora larici-populina 98AG31]EGG11120.1 hypothetical protein MELLADRAFT_33552 [Melampsora larici-populina 98AG31]
MKDHQQRVEYLKSLKSIRESCQEVYNLSHSNKLEFWSIQPNQLPVLIDYCTNLIHRDFGTDYHKIPPHGRWRHFLVNDQDRITPLLTSWKSTHEDPLEPTRKLIDLFVVAVLMDAGAGDEWSFQEPTSQPQPQGNQGIGRSEGLAIGTLYGFMNGLFSSDPQVPHQVDPIGLKSLTLDQLSKSMQSRPGNQIVGLQGRTTLLNNLGSLLSTPSEFFPSRQLSRPGNLLDYLMDHPQVRPVPKPVMKGEIIVPVDVLWNLVIDQEKGLGSIWPHLGREQVHGQFIGDVWNCKALETSKSQTLQDGFVSFHKLSQWLTYSLIEVMEKTLGWIFTGKEQMTGLPEYRNGGLLIDLDYLKPKPEAFINSLSLQSSIENFDLQDLPALPASHPAIIEWRALTVIGLDQIKEGINQRLGLVGKKNELSLVQVLEAATWKGGREIAWKKRSVGGLGSAGPPLKVVSDGTIF